MNDLGRRQPVKSGQGVIRKNQVNAAMFERRHKFIARLHARDRILNALGLQRALNERGIVWIILQVQDAQ